MGQARWHPTYDVQCKLQLDPCHGVCELFLTDPCGFLERTDDRLGALLERSTAAPLERDIDEPRVQVSKEHDARGHRPGLQT